MGRRVTVLLCSILVFCGFYFAVRSDPHMLSVGLAGTTPRPDWWPGSGATRFLLELLVPFAIWISSGALSIPSIVKAYYPDMNRVGWMVFAVYAAFHVFMYGLPDGWGWLESLVIIMFCSQAMLFGFLKTAQS